MKIDKAILELPPILKNKICFIKKIGIGLTNDNFLILLQGGERCVVRVPGIGTDLFIDRATEYDTTNKISELSIDISPIYFSQKTGIKVTRYVETITDFDKRREHIIHAVIMNIKRVHNSNIYLLKTYRFENEVNMYTSALKQLGSRIDKRIQIFIDQIYTLEASLNFEREMRPCHFDPVMENWLFRRDGGINLIDWEYAAMNDPLWDIATIFFEFNVDKKDQEKYILLYLGEAVIKEEVWKRLKLYLIQQHFIWYLWSLLKACYGAHVLPYGKRRLTLGVKELLDYGSFY